MSINFDLISDLYLAPDESFNWENKPTSLYCIIAGNISSDLRTITSTLNSLCRVYQGVFYIPGYLEYSQSSDFEKTTDNITRIVKKFKNCALLQNHVVIINGVALLGCNGWHSKEDIVDEYKKEMITTHRFDDLVYVKNSIDKLQKHLDIKRIVMVSNAVPLNYLFYGEVPKHLNSEPELALTLVGDSEGKVSQWVFGTYEKIVDTTIGNINYLNNSYLHKKPYWPKRFEVNF